MSNAYATHSAVALAEPGCSGLAVGDREVMLSPGQLFGFDNSFRHSAWNGGTTTRIIISTYTTHPFLMAEEVVELEKVEEAHALLRRAVGGALREGKRLRERILR